MSHHRFDMHVCVCQQGDVEDADKPTGMLEVMVIEAENVPKKDLVTKPDAYIR